MRGGLSLYFREHQGESRGDGFAVDSPHRQNKKAPFGVFSF